jgi:hypothetical protein
MTVEQIARSLVRAGAPATEARDLSEVLYINGWSEEPGGKANNSQLVALSTWWADWRREKQALAAEIRADRQRRLDAGYRSLPVEAGVWLNGETLW